MTMPRAKAADEALQQFRKASAERRRAAVYVQRQSGDPVEVTEDVISVLDLMTTSMNWGSGFWYDEDLEAFTRLCGLLEVQTEEGT